MSELLHVSGLTRVLGEGEAKTHALRGVDLSLTPGKLYAVVGPSGCGKSTLLYLLGLLDRPDGGEIRLEGERVDNASETVRTRARNLSLGFVFQFHFLLPEFSAEENVLLPLHKAAALPLEQRRARARKLLASVGLEGKATRLTGQLSGGEQQRVAVARSLANAPRLLLADEPTGNLDQKNSQAIFELLARVAREEGKAILLVTHNRALAGECDEIFEMADGRFV